VPGTSFGIRILGKTSIKPVLFLMLGSEVYTVHLVGSSGDDFVSCQALKAITATAHKLGRIVYHLLRHGEAYVREHEEKYAGEARERRERQFHRRAKELGYVVLRLKARVDASPTSEASKEGESMSGIG